MLLQNTDKARAALQSRSHALSALERRILILSDGRRRLDEITGMLGGDARDAALRLVEGCFLDDIDTRGGLASRLASWTSAGTGKQPAPRAIASVPTVPANAPSPPLSKVSSTPAPTRRSLAAAKMYMLDMLQLQRDARAAELRSSLQTSVGPDALVAAILEGAEFIRSTTPDSYGARVHQRLGEVLPEDALGALGATRAPPSRTASG